MSIEDTKEIDAIGIDKITGFVTLAIIDSNDWEEEGNHLLKLQEKINIYLSFIESGEIYRTYPESKDKKIEIKIHFKNLITRTCEKFLETVKQIINEAGFIFNYEIHNTK